MTMLEDGATHIGVATDHVIESFRNVLWPGYKTGDGVDPLLKAQFPLLEEVLIDLGVAVWAIERGMKPQEARKCLSSDVSIFASSM